MVINVFSILFKMTPMVVTKFLKLRLNHEHPHFSADQVAPVIHGEGLPAETGTFAPFN